MEPQKAYCYYCGVPLTEVEKVMASFTPGYQCRHCWNRLRVVTDPGWPLPKTGAKTAQQTYRANKRSAA